MANLINGNGYPAVYADQDADWYASIMGNVTSITGVGQQFEATILDAQTIGVADGVIITKEGRRIQLDANQVDTFDIPVGEQGTTNYYIIGYQLVTQEDSSQVAETFVQLMENATDTIEEETFRGGADEVYVSLYRVTQVGLSITSIDLLLPVIPNMQNIRQLESDLTVKHTTVEIFNGTSSGSWSTPIPSDAKYIEVYFSSTNGGDMARLLPVNMLSTTVFPDVLYWAHPTVAGYEMWCSYGVTASGINIKGMSGGPNVGTFTFKVIAIS